MGRGAGLAAVLLLAWFGGLDPRAAPLQWQVWTLCVLQLVWTHHLWRMAQRARIVDDPVMFALRDTTTRIAGVLLLLSWVAA